MKLVPTFRLDLNQGNVKLRRSLLKWFSMVSLNCTRYNNKFILVRVVIWDREALSWYEFYFY